jgi:hypothetical protein
MRVNVSQFINAYFSAICRHVENGYASELSETVYIYMFIYLFKPHFSLASHNITHVSVES